jgi:hypothetical protein
LLLWLELKWLYLWLLLILTLRCCNLFKLKLLRRENLLLRLLLCLRSHTLWLSILLELFKYKRIYHLLSLWLLLDNLIINNWILLLLNLCLWLLLLLLRNRLYILISVLSVVQCPLISRLIDNLQINKMIWFIINL